LVQVDRSLWHSFVGGNQLVPFIQRLLLSTEQAVRATSSAMLQTLAPFQVHPLEESWLPEALSVAAIMDKLLIEACNCPSEDDRSQQAFQAINKLLPCFSQAQASLSTTPQHEDVSGESKLKVVCEGLLTAIFQHQTIEAFSETTEDYKLQCILGVLSTLLEQNKYLASIVGMLVATRRAASSADNYCAQELTSSSIFCFKIACSVFQNSFKDAIADFQR
jgi:hypothetical protein